MSGRFDFGEALRRLKAGQHVARDGWNGKGMYLWLQYWAEDPRSCTFEPAVVMFTAQRRHQPGWLASQADMLAEDWGIVT